MGGLSETPTRTRRRSWQAGGEEGRLVPAPRPPCPPGRQTYPIRPCTARPTQGALRYFTVTGGDDGRRHVADLGERGLLIRGERAAAPRTRCPRAGKRPFEDAFPDGRELRPFSTEESDVRRCLSPPRPSNRGDQRVKSPPNVTGLPTASSDAERSPNCHSVRHPSPETLNTL